MVEILVALVLVTSALLWIALAGKATNTRFQSVVSLVLFSLLNFGAHHAIGLYADQLTYVIYGQRLAEAILVDPFSARSGWTPGGQSYVWLIAFVFILVGESVWPLLSMSVLFMLVLPAVVVWVGRNFGLTSDGRINAWLSVISPPLLLWGHGVNKEPLVFMLLALSLLGASQIYCGRIVRGVLTVSFSALLLAITRDSLLVVLLALVVVILWLRYRESQPRQPEIGSSLVERIALASGTVALTSAGFFALRAVHDTQYWQQFGAGIPELSSPEQATALLGASWEQNSSAAGLALNFGKSLFGPPPWEVTNASLAFFSVEGLMYLVLTYLLVIGAFFSDKERKIIGALILSTLPLVLASSLLLANYGLNSRLRAHAFVMLVVAFEPAILAIWEKTRQRRPMNARSRRMLPGGISEEYGTPPGWRSHRVGWLWESTRKAKLIEDAGMSGQASAPREQHSRKPR